MVSKAGMLGVPLIPKWQDVGLSFFCKKKKKGLTVRRFFYISNQIVLQPKDPTSFTLFNVDHVSHLEISPLVLNI